MHRLGLIRAGGQPGTYSPNRFVCNHQAGQAGLSFQRTAQLAGNNRLRLTADGNLRPCLLSDVEVPLLTTLRAGGDIRPLLYRSMEIKPENHELNRNIAPVARCMMQIGG